MVKWFGFALLGISIFAANPLLAQSDSMQSAGNDMSNHYDKEQNIYYDYQVVCDFVGEYFEVKDKIPEKEWKDFEKGKYSRFLNASDIYSGTSFYEYAHNGIGVNYSKNIYGINISEVFYRADKLPLDMRHKQYFLDKFRIEGLNYSGSLEELYCDGAVMYVLFKGEKLISLRMKYVGVD